MAMATSNPERFADDFAQYILERLWTDTLHRDESRFVFRFQNGKMSVANEFKGFYELRNPAGQTYLYRLLRFTLNEFYRDAFIRTATADQLAMQNTDCGSSAISGNFLGQIERIAAKIPVQGPRSPVYVQLTSIKTQFDEAAYEDFMTINNKKGETALTLARTLQFKMCEVRCKELEDGVWRPY
jgi:hypothetical protein